MPNDLQMPLVDLTKFKLSVRHLIASYRIGTFLVTPHVVHYAAKARCTHAGRASLKHRGSTGHQMTATRKFVCSISTPEGDIRDGGWNEVILQCLDNSGYVVPERLVNRVCMAKRCRNTRYMWKKRAVCNMANSRRRNQKTASQPSLCSS